MHVFLVETWMTPYRRYLADGVLPLEPAEARTVMKNSSRYTLVDGNLFRHGYIHPILICVSGEQCTHIMAKLHEGICGSHIGGRALLSKAVRVGYYWPTMREYCTKYAQLFPPVDSLRRLTPTDALALQSPPEKCAFLIKKPLTCKDKGAP